MTIPGNFRTTPFQPPYAPLRAKPTHKVVASHPRQPPPKPLWVDPPSPVRRKFEAEKRAEDERRGAPLAEYYEAVRSRGGLSARECGVSGSRFSSFDPNDVAKTAEESALYRDLEALDARMENLRVKSVGARMYEHYAEAFYRPGGATESSETSARRKVERDRETERARELAMEDGADKPDGAPRDGSNGEYPSQRAEKRWASRRGPGGTRRGSGRTPALSPGTRSTRRVDFDGSPNRPSSRFAPRASPRRPRRRRRSPPRRSWAYRTTESRRPGRKASTKFHERRPRGRRRNARVTWLASDPSSRSLGATSTRWPGSGGGPGERRAGPWKRDRVASARADAAFEREVSSANEERDEARVRKAAAVSAVERHRIQHALKVKKLARENLEFEERAFREAEDERARMEAEHAAALKAMAFKARMETEMEGTYALSAEELLAYPGPPNPYELGATSFAKKDDQGVEGPASFVEQRRSRRDGKDADKKPAAGPKAWGGRDKSPAAARAERARARGERTPRARPRGASEIVRRRREGFGSRGAASRGRRGNEGSGAGIVGRESGADRARARGRRRGRVRFQASA